MHFPSDGMQIFDHDDRRFSCGYASGLIYFYGKEGRLATLGTRGMRWRKIECSLRVEIKSEGGKLGVIYNDDFTDDAIELRVWVLEDVEKQKWTKYAYTLRSDKLFPHYASEVGVISTSEIMLSMADYASKQPFYIYYFNPERNTIRRVEIQGFGRYHEASKNPSRDYIFLDDCSRFCTFVDHVENLNVNDPTLLKSSIYVPCV
ncbi:hypothetical protein HID58_079661 [Brassica napus]|uniref:F-box associated beta-propeller type 3 domain-containing protein n=1 Tax=Brassica napus TaxID=3708 RepID=A0ABQ7Y2N0_BRANA|nr:hypothetical protein HID58_079661 [Brassica napus]